MRNKTEEMIRKRIKAAQMMEGYSNSEMAIKMHMSEASWERRLNHPKLIKIEDLLKIDKILHTEFLAV